MHPPHLKQSVRDGKATVYDILTLSLAFGFHFGFGGFILVSPGRVVFILVSPGRAEIKTGISGG